MSNIPEVDIEVMRGDGDVYTLTITQGGAALSIVGAELWYTAKRSIKDTDADAVIRKGNTAPLTGITVTNAVGGIAELAFVATDTEGLSLAGIKELSFYHDAQIQFPGGQPHTLFFGTLTISLDITRERN